MYRGVLFFSFVKAGVSVVVMSTRYLSLQRVLFFWTRNIRDTLHDKT